MSDKNFGNVIGGYKATLNNPNVSDEAKVRARQNNQLSSQQTDQGFGGDSFSAGNGKYTGNVLGGHKANLANPNTSDESKQRSQQFVDEFGAQVGGEAQDKANLRNPNTSEASKDRSRQALDDFEQQ